MVLWYRSTFLVYFTMLVPSNTNLNIDLNAHIELGDKNIITKYFNLN